ncbi:MAG: hypothetical protein Q4G59_11960 [Planctomycetia bacterium]|nr:hypothetical protein [Planctomycetia bacterium]
MIILFNSCYQFISICFDSDEREQVTLVGNMNTMVDIVADDIVLSKMNVGDVIRMTNAGSYAASLSPTQFSSHDPPVEFFLDRNGNVLM